MDEEFRRESDVWGKELGKTFLRKACFVKKFCRSDSNYGFRKSWLGEWKNNVEGLLMEELGKDSTGGSLHGGQIRSTE